MRFSCATDARMLLAQSTRTSGCNRIDTERSSSACKIRHRDWGAHRDSTHDRQPIHVCSDRRHALQTVRHRGDADRTSGCVQGNTELDSGTREVGHRDWRGHQDSTSDRQPIHVEPIQVSCSGHSDGRSVLRAHLSCPLRFPLRQLVGTLRLLLRLNLLQSAAHTHEASHER